LIDIYRGSYNILKIDFPSYPLTSIQEVTPWRSPSNCAYLAHYRVNLASSQKLVDYFWHGELSQAMMQGKFELFRGPITEGSMTDRLCPVVESLNTTIIGKNLETGMISSWWRRNIQANFRIGSSLEFVAH